MSKRCDHTSVGILVFRKGRLLLIERKRPPFGFAPPAGHVDGDDSFEGAAMRELAEEVGLKANRIELLVQGRKENPCRREDGGWHDWMVYRVEASGEPKPSADEAKHAGFYGTEELNSLAERTKRYLAGGLTEEEWERVPGLAPVWHEWLSELHIIQT